MWVCSLATASLSFELLRTRKQKPICMFAIPYSSAFSCFNGLTDSLGMHCLMSSHQACDLSSPIIHVSWAFCGCPLFTHYIVLWWINLLGILGQLNPSLTELCDKESTSPYAKWSRSEDVDFGQLLLTEKKRDSVPSALLSRFHLSFASLYTAGHGDSLWFVSFADFLINKIFNYKINYG